MLLTLALLVLFCAIVVFFSNEFANFFKKLFAIRGMKLLLPLILATTLIVLYEHWVSWGVLYARWLLHVAVTTMANRFPFPGSLLITKILILMVLAVLPVVVIDFLEKRRRFEPFRYSFITSMIIWLVVAMLLTASYGYL
ncbi:Uncharacterised protein [Legionella lansingensis]|uniref:Uncharacterized protein n=1 Tax=Legionella lansingensis TaxID=45067 RepID=A0A0W0VL53_9GAMM|nr:hypothetical protein [Legionella lansingensis]KTD20534.1 hypothetical protein Llan_1787 [Legionella lansingensis]SNV47651.1 Uncharacterised protein [Legionella lansingensis]